MGEHGPRTEHTSTKNVYVPEYGGDLSPITHSSLVWWIIKMRVNMKAGGLIS